jgi:hypothetical protein
MNLILKMIVVVVEGGPALIRIAPYKAITAGKRQSFESSGTEIMQ